MLIVLGSSLIKGQTSVLRAQSFNDATVDTVAVARFHWGFASTKSSSICHLWTVLLVLSRKCSVLLKRVTKMCLVAGDGGSGGGVIVSVSTGTPSLLC